MMDFDQLKYLTDLLTLRKIIINPKSLLARSVALQGRCNFLLARVINRTLLPVGNDKRKRTGTPARSLSALRWSPHFDFATSRMTRAISQLLPDAYFSQSQDAILTSAYVWLHYTNNFYISHPERKDVFVGAISHVASEQICFEIAASIIKQL